MTKIKAFYTWRFGMQRTGMWLRSFYAKSKSISHTEKNVSIFVSFISSGGGNIEELYEKIKLGLHEAANEELGEQETKKQKCPG